MSGDIQAITGYSATDFIHDGVRSYLSLVHPDDLGTLKDALVCTVLDQNPCVLHYRIQHANGELRWVAEHKQRIWDEYRGLLRFESVLLDISNDIHSESDLQSDHLQSDQMTSVLSSMFEGLKTLKQ